MRRYIMKEEQEIQKLLKEAQSYFGKDETIYIFKCKKCGKLDPVPSFIVNEEAGFLKFMGKKSIPKMECPYCNGTMTSIYNSN